MELLFAHKKECPSCSLHALAMNLKYSYSNERRNLNLLVTIARSFIVFWKSFDFTLERQQERDASIFWLQNKNTRITWAHILKFLLLYNCSFISAINYLAKEWPKNNNIVAKDNFKRLDIKTKIKLLISCSFKDKV